MAEIKFCPFAMYGGYAPNITKNFGCLCMTKDCQLWDSKKKMCGLVR